MIYQPKSSIYNRKLNNTSRFIEEYLDNASSVKSLGKGCVGEWLKVRVLHRYNSLN
nr:MAG TPA: hypothetical protein [Caudoviricetes sp.]